MATFILPKSSYDIKKVDSKIKLYKSLNNYWGILDKSIIDYLNSLIELEFSVIQKNISDKDRKALSELEIYNRIAIYNIYNRALNLFKQNNLNLKINSNSNNYECLDVSIILDNQYISLFNYNYKNDFNSNNDKVENIGNISLYKTINNLKQLKFSLDKINSQLGKLEKEKNPYNDVSKSKIMPTTYGSPYSYWISEHEKKINEYNNLKNKLIKRLECDKPLSDIDKKKVEITNLFYQKLLDDYGLKESEFIKEKYDNDLNIKLIKKLPNMTIESNVTNII